VASRERNGVSIVAALDTAVGMLLCLIGMRDIEHPNMGWMAWGAAMIISGALCSIAARLEK